MNESKRTSVDSRSKIIEATLSLIAEKGPEALRTREILKRASVANLSAISYHFGSLDKLREQALERYFERARGMFADLETIKEPREAILAFCRKMATFVLENPALERNIVYFAMSSERPAPFFSQVLQANLQVLRKLLSRSRGTSETDDKTALDAIVLASATIYPLLLSSYGSVSVGIDASDEEARERYFNNLADLLLGRGK